jgi:hypothetical protein
MRTMLNHWSVCKFVLRCWAQLGVVKSGRESTWFWMLSSRRSLTLNKICTLTFILDLPFWFAGERQSALLFKDRADNYFYFTKSLGTIPFNFPPHCLNISSVGCYSLIYPSSPLNSQTIISQHTINVKQQKSAIYFHFGKAQTEIHWQNHSFSLQGRAGGECYLCIRI